MTDALPPVEIRTFRAQDGCEIAYRLWATGVSDSASVAIVHGLGLHSGRYAGLATKLRAAGYDVFALDLRGHGLSKGSRGELPSPATILSDLERFFQLARRDSDHTLSAIGESMGGLIALVACSQPTVISKLVLISPGLRPHRHQLLGWRPLLDVVSTTLRRRAPSISLLGWRLEATSETSQHVIQTRADSLTLSFVTWRYGLALFRFARRARQITRLACPLLVVQGGRDLVVSVDEVCRAYSRIQSDKSLHFLSQAFHALLWDKHRDEVSDGIVAWLGRTESSPRAASDDLR